VSERADDVALDFPAELRYLPLARAVTAALAVVHDLTVNDITDLRLAIDEMCTTLIPLAAAGVRAHCELTVDDNRLTVTTRVRVLRVELPDPESVGWRILTALSDSVSTYVDERLGSNGTRPLVMTMVKRRSFAG
jgi:serine/threonine-protein kinase RsbW